MNAAVKTAPFDLEAAKRGEAVCRGDGRPVRFVGYVPEDTQYPFWCADPDGMCIAFTIFGQARWKCSVPPNDLRMVVKTKTVWVNLFWIQGVVTTGGHIYASEAEAMHDAPPHVLRTVSVEVPV